MIGRSEVKNSLRLAEILREEDSISFAESSNVSSTFMEWIENENVNIEYTFLVLSQSNPKAQLQITFQSCEDDNMYSSLNCTDQQVIF
jgi:hypothetical protein